MKLMCSRSRVPVAIESLCNIINIYSAIITFHKECNVLGATESQLSIINHCGCVCVHAHITFTCMF